MYGTELWPAWTSGGIWSTQRSVQIRVGNITADLKMSNISLSIIKRTAEEVLSDKNKFSPISKCLKHSFQCQVYLCFLPLLSDFPDRSF